MDIKLPLFISLSALFLVYSLFVYTSGTELTHPEINNSSASRGKALWQKHNCIACHQLYGLGGYLGPDLTTVISQKGKGEQYAKAFIKNGTQRMPDFHLNEEEIQSILDYLNSVSLTAVTYK